MASETILAIVALVVSVVALLIAVAQLLAQTVGTVEGYRRCQSSVLGGWSEHAKRRWRWDEFRFETVFSTPEILLSPRHMHRSGIFPIEDIPQENGSIDVTNELVCWVPLLRSIYESVGSVFRSLHTSHGDIDLTSNLSWPSYRLMTRSWDFMTPDIVRPYATTTVSDIAILACRMGMIWKEFNPAMGVMEGHGANHIFSATKLRGIGTMLTYTKMPVDYKVERELQGARGFQQRPKGLDMSECSIINVLGKNYPVFSLKFIWTSAADMLWFGILPGNPTFNLPNLKVRTQGDIRETLFQLDPEGVAVRHLKGMQLLRHDYLHGFADIIPMMAPWLQQMDTIVNWYPRLLENNTVGLTWYHTCYKSFKVNLNQYNGSTPSDQTEYIATAYEELSRDFKEEWDGISQNLLQRPERFFQKLRFEYDKTTSYFNALDKRMSLAYLHLVTAHLREAPRSYVDAQQRIRSSSHLHRADWKPIAMDYYWKYMPDYVRFMSSMGDMDKSKVEEAWITLMFRAFLWMRAHVPVDHFPLVPSQYYGSRLPVYIS